MENAPTNQQPSAFRRIIGKLGFTLVVLLLVLFVVGSLRYLPMAEKVRITGTDVRRLDKSAKDGTVLTEDIRYVMTETLDGDSKVLENRDTKWGWPPYFKFDSSELQERAMALEKDPTRVALVRYYGWRIQLLEMYPNLISIRAVDRTYEDFPLFNIVYFSMSLLFALFIVFKLWRRKRRKRKEAAAAEASLAAEPPAEDGAA